MSIPWIVLMVGLAMMLCERLYPGRNFPSSRSWLLRAILLNGAQAGCIYLAGAVWEPFLMRSNPWLLKMPVIPGALIGYFVLTFVYYWWHRWRHESAFLWRWIHQMHHSPQRIEILTSFYKHPLEILANGLLSSTVLYVGLGISPEAATGAVLLCGIAELFYHWNVATPRWLGFLIQRPESHCLHHQEGVHSFNYSDLPLWDMIFGTYHNPQNWRAQCGLGGDLENRFLDLLAGKRLTSY